MIGVYRRFCVSSATTVGAKVGLVLTSIRYLTALETAVHAKTGFPVTVLPGPGM